jgi:Fe-S cluster assembly protein SufD
MRIQNQNSLQPIFQDVFQKLIPLFSNNVSSLQLRRDALNHFDKVGLPSSRDDNWKYTDLSSYPFHILQAATARQEVPLEEIDPLLIEETSQQWLFTNGHSIKEFSSSSFLIHKLSQFNSSPDIHINNGFQALNTALYYDGVHLVLPENVVIKKPIIIVHTILPHSGPLMVHPRNVIIAEENSEATIIELYWNKGVEISFTNTMSQYTLKKGANIKHLCLQRGTPKSLQISHIRVEQAENSHYTGTLVITDSGINRTTVDISLDGKNAECRFYSLTTPKEHQKTDVAFSVKHSKPACKSHIMARSVVQDQAQNSFTGKIIVEKNATKTKASLESKNLLLNAKATVNTRPQLEIYNDDVQCAHGATVGFLDPEALFYLRSRGLCQAEATKLLIRGFVYPSLQAVPSCALKYVEKLIYDN